MDINHEQPREIEHFKSPDEGCEFPVHILSQPYTTPQQARNSRKRINPGQEGTAKEITATDESRWLLDEFQPDEARFRFHLCIFFCYHQ